MIKVWIDNEVDEGGHKNLFLLIDSIDFKQVADTYYFALDNHLMPESESGEKVALNLKLLLKWWIYKTKALNPNEAIYLPFDFSDQYVGCLKVEAISANELSILYGSTQKYEGHGINPSQPDEFILISDDFIPTTNEFKLTKVDFANAIQKSISNLAVQNK